MTIKKTKSKESTALATVVDAGALASIDFGDNAGAGKENMTSEDRSIPFLTVLQALSKCLSDPGKKVEGAEAGMFMDSVTKKLYTSEEGILIIPVSTRHEFVEWQGDPGSGKVVSRRGSKDPEVVNAKRNQEFGKWTTKAGNRLVETFYVLGLVMDSVDAEAPSRYVLIPFTSTKIGQYRKVFGELHSMVKFLKFPLWAHMFRMTTFAETHPKGTSYNISVWPEGAEDEKDLEKALCHSSALILPGNERNDLIYSLAATMAADYNSGDLEEDIAYNTEGNNEGGAGATEDEPY